MSSVNILAEDTNTMAQAPLCTVYRDGCPKRDKCLLASRCLDLREAIANRLVPRQIPDKDFINPKDLIGDTKVPFRFIPPSALTYLAFVMELGAGKYGPMNWRTKKIRATVYYEAALRHIFAALDGEEIDPESGQPHAAHAMACMGILLDALATGNLIDDLFEPGTFGKMTRELIKEKKS